MSDAVTLPVAPEAVRNALQLVAQVCRSHRITALDDFIESCRTFAGEETLNVAILGRFKAGKSSFLNHLLGRQVLPIGAVPVTAVVTEIEYGPRDAPEVVFQDGNIEAISPERIGEFISETENPGNSKAGCAGAAGTVFHGAVPRNPVRGYAGTGERPGT